MASCKDLDGYKWHRWLSSMVYYVNSEKLLLLAIYCTYSPGKEHAIKNREANQRGRLSIMISWSVASADKRCKDTLS